MIGQRLFKKAHGNELLILYLNDATYGLGSFRCSMLKGEFLSWLWAAAGVFKDCELFALRVRLGRCHNPRPPEVVG